MEQKEADRSVSFSDEVLEIEPNEDAADKQEGGEDKDESSNPEFDRHFNKFQLLELVENNEPGQVESDEVDDESEELDGDGGASCQKSTKQQQQQNSPLTKHKQRKRRHKSKSSKANKANWSNGDDDELFLLANVKNNSQADRTHKNKDLTFKNSDSHIQLLKLDMRNLIPENELKRMFGKSVLKEDKTRNRHSQPMGASIHRSKFVSSIYLDPRTAHLRFGLKMELDGLFNGEKVGGTQSPVTIKSETGNNDGKKQQEKKLNHSNAISSSNQSSNISNQPIYFKFVHDKSYQAAQAMFLDSAIRGNSESIVQNLNIYPAHSESLIQLSDMIRISEDYKTASELIERALLVFERGFHQKFNISQASCRLSYKRPENRTFFIALFKHIIYINRRGLRRTPLEYTKLLLSLDPENDPLFATLLIDFYAIRSEEYDFLIEFQTRWQQLSRLPNMNFSLALAYFMKSCNMKRGKSESEVNLNLADECLQKALLRYPNFIIPLLDACSAEPDSELKKCDYFDYSVYSKKYKIVPESVELLVSIYVQRTSMLWKNKSVLAWLEKNIVVLVTKFANGVLEDIGQQKEYWSSFKGPAPRNLLRHIVLSDLKVKIPPSAASTTVLDIDPYPPESIVSYRTSLTTTSASTSQPSRGLPSLFIRSILPSFSLGGEQQGSSHQLQQQQVPASSSDDQVTYLAGELERELNDHASRYIDASVNAGEPINLENIQHSIQNVLSSLTSLLIGTESRQSPGDAEEHGRRGNNNHRQG